MNEALETYNNDTAEYCDGDCLDNNGESQCPKYDDCGSRMEVEDEDSEL